MADTPPEDGARWERQIRIRLTRGEAAALGELYDRHARLVHGLAARLTGEDKATRDLVERVFVDLWLHPDAFDPSRYRLTTWLAVRTCELGAERVPPGRVHAHQDVGDTRADEAITDLSSGVRRALHLAHTERLDYRQTAAVTGVSEEKTLSRLRLGLRTIAARAGTVSEDGR